MEPKTSSRWSHLRTRSSLRRSCLLGCLFYLLLFPHLRLCPESASLNAFGNNYKKKLHSLFKLILGDTDTAILTAPKGCVRSAILWKMQTVPNRPVGFAMPVHLRAEFVLTIPIECQLGCEALGWQPPLDRLGQVVGDGGRLQGAMTQVRSIRPLEHPSRTGQQRRERRHRWFVSAYLVGSNTHSGLCKSRS